MSPLRDLASKLLIASSLALGGCAASATVVPHPVEPAGKQREFEELLEQVRKDRGVPAMAAAFVRDGKIVAAAAVGVRRSDSKIPVTINDKFHVGSVSKPISATVIATLVEDHVLEWDTRVTDVFPDLASRINPAYLQVTLAQLLSHRAGVLPWEKDEDVALCPVVAGSPQQQRRAAVLWILTQDPVAPPGTEHVYSNGGYMVAAAMAEEAAHEPWEDLVLDRLAKPLHLKSFGIGWPARIDPSQPWGHRSSPQGPVPHDPQDSYQAGPLLGPAGDFHMTITDLAQFALLHLEGVQGRAVLLTPETFKKLHQPVGDYALGWNVRETADHHLGGMGTFVAGIWVSVPRNVAVVAVTNASTDVSFVSDVINGSLRVFDVPKP